MKLRIFLALTLLALGVVSLWGQSHYIFDASGKKLRESPEFGKGAIPINDEGKVVYRYIIELEGLSQKEVYNRAVNALGKLFPKYMREITVQDEQKNILKGKGKFEFMFKKGVTGIQLRSDYIVHFDIQIECREGRSRVTIDNIYLRNLEYDWWDDVANPDFSDSKTLDKKGHVKNSYRGYERIGIIASYMVPTLLLEEYMKENEKITIEEW